MVHVARRRRPASIRPDRPDRVPVVPAPPPRGSPAPTARSRRSETRGRAFVPSRVPGRTCSTRDGSETPARRRRTRLRLPGGSARCTRASRRWDEARTVVRRSRSAAGRAPSEVSQVAAEGRPAGCGRARGTECVGHGHPGKRATGRGVLGWSGGRRPAAGCRGRATSIRSGAVSRPSRERRTGRQGNELRKEPGDTDRRAGTGEPRAGADSGSPRARTSPVAAPGARACAGQPVARERSGRPCGLMPGTATAPRGTGGIHRGPVDAGPWGGSTAAGEGAAGRLVGIWIVGVLGISRRTTGRSAVGRAAGRAGPPQAR